MLKKNNRIVSMEFSKLRKYFFLFFQKVFLIKKYFILIILNVKMQKKKIRKINIILTNKTLI